jgi:hypothetical protein
MKISTYTEERISDMYRDLQAIEAMHHDLLDELRLLSQKIHPVVIQDWE